MYESFFEMTKTPFTRGIPVDMLYSNNDNEEIYNRLVYAAKKQLFAILIGDAGAGKTTTLRHLYEKLDGPSYAVLYLADSDLTPRMPHSDSSVHIDSICGKVTLSMDRR